MSEIADAINDTVGDLFGGVADDGTEDTVSVAAPEAEVAAEQTQEAPEEAWDFESAGRDLFAEDEEEEPDFAALADTELGGSEEAQDVLAPTEYDDENTRELKKQLLAEKKRAEYHARRHLETARKSWEADVKKQPWAEFLPADLSTVKASSRRDFNRQVKALARQNYTVLKPHFEKLQAERARVHQATVEQAKADATKAWGKPTVGGMGQVPAAAEQQETQSRIDRGIQRRSMVDVTKAYIDSGLI